MIHRSLLLDRVGRAIKFAAPRRLASGEFVCYYGAPAPGGELFSVDMEPLAWVATPRSWILGYGVFVDETATNVAARFYTCRVPIPPPPQFRLPGP